MFTSRPFTALAVLAVLAGASSLSPEPAAARQRASAVRTAPGDVSVDVSRLRALGLGPTAEVLGAAVAEALRGGESVGGGRIVVRLTALSLNAYAGSNGGGGGGGSGGSSGSGSDYDYLEGEVLVLGPGGEILSQRPQVAALPANSGGAYYMRDAERRRVVAIGQHFAAWARRSSL